MSDRLLRRSYSTKTVTAYMFAIKCLAKHLGLSPTRLLDKIESGEIQT